MIGAQADSRDIACGVWTVLWGLRWCSFFGKIRTTWFVRKCSFISLHLVWSVEAVLMRFGVFDFHWYGVLFAGAFALGTTIMKLI